MVSVNLCVRSLRPLQFFPSHWERLQNRRNDGPAPTSSPQSVYTMTPMGMPQAFVNAREIVVRASLQRHFLRLSQPFFHRGTGGLHRQYESFDMCIGNPQSIIPATRYFGLIEI